MSEDRRTQTGIAVALAAIVLLGAYLRIESLHTAPLWFDERALAKVVREARSVWTLLAIGQTHNFEHPPLYYVLAYATSRTFDHPLAVRWPAAAAGILGILTTFALAKRVYGPRGGLIAAFLVAV